MGSALVLRGASGAPKDANYIVQTANAGLSAEQAMGALATGIVKNTTTTGVQTIATLGRDYSLGCHVVEPFDGLSTAAIHGQGVYNSCAAWASTLSGTSTANVTVKSGADKMLTLTAVAAGAESLSALILSSRWGFMGGGRISWKMRTSDADKTNAGLKVNIGNTQYGAVYFFTDSKIYFWDGTTATAIKTGVADNTWYQIDYLITTGTTTARVAVLFVDGVYVATLATKAYAALVNEIRFFVTPHATNNFALDVDDLVIVNAMGLDT